MILPTPGAHEQFVSSMFLGGLSTINIKPSNIHTWAILYSGATSHFLVTMTPKSSASPAANSLRVSLPNGDTVQSTHTCTLALPQLPAKARFGNIIRGLAAYSLLSVVKLCDAGCQVTFTKINCTVRMRGRVLMTGRKNTKTGLWMLSLFMNKSTISPAAASTLSQVASDTLQPIATTAHQKTHSVSPNLPALVVFVRIMFCSHSTLYHQNTHSCFYC